MLFHIFVFYLIGLKNSVCAPHRRSIFFSFCHYHSTLFLTIWNHIVVWRAMTAKATDYIGKLQNSRFQRRESGWFLHKYQKSQSVLFKRSSNIKDIHATRTSAEISSIFVLNLFEQPFSFFPFCPNLVSLPFANGQRRFGVVIRTSITSAFEDDAFCTVWR